jgi:hypothetical protein
MEEGTFVTENPQEMSGYSKMYFLGVFVGYDTPSCKRRHKTSLP